MRILVLMPTYGRPRLVENAIAMFLAQDHPAEDRHLLILDDAGQLPSTRGHGWTIVSTPRRFKTLTGKYIAMVREIAPGVLAHPPDAYALMDDDDIYGPSWLSSHDQALQKSAWSHPRAVWSLHRPPAFSPTRPGLEPSAGRFWASAAVTAGLLHRTGGFQDIARPTFDQEHLRLWHDVGGYPGRPDDRDDHLPPQYVYGWGRAKRHVSAGMGRADWYESHPQSDRQAIEAIRPRLDRQTQGVLAWLAGDMPELEAIEARGPAHAM